MDLPPHRWASLANANGAKALRESEAVWQCLACLTCEARCPRGVRLALMAEEARETAQRPEAGSRFSTDDIPPRLTEGMPQQLLVAALRRMGP
jgi:heterodisulfide reductase subunit C